MGRTQCRSLTATLGKSQGWICCSCTGKGLVLQMLSAHLEPRVPVLPTCVQEHAVLREPGAGCALLGASQCHNAVLASALSHKCVHSRLTAPGSWKALVFANCCFGWNFSSYCYGNCN